MMNGYKHLRNYKIIWFCRHNTALILHGTGKLKHRVKDDNVSRGPYFCSHTELKSEYFYKCEQAQNWTCCFEREQC
jgi:hypothetical protein